MGLMGAAGPRGSPGQDGLPGQPGELGYPGKPVRGPRVEAICPKMSIESLPAHYLQAY